MERSNEKNILFLLSLTVLTGSGFGWFAWKKAVVVEAKDDQENTRPFESINQKARNSRQGGKADTEELVAQIINVSGFESELRGFTSTVIEERVGQAESLYRQGQSEGIPEAKIVRTVNGLAKKFDLPQYTRTDAYEVRKLRLELLPVFPQIITQKQSGIQRTFVEKRIDSQMSPAEALLVLTMMLQQKLANPEYQLTPKERAGRWAEMHNHRPGQSVDSSRLLQNRNGDIQNRSGEVKAALLRAAQSTSVSDSLNLSDITLNTLGIE